MINLQTFEKQRHNFLLHLLDKIVSNNRLKRAQVLYFKGIFKNKISKLFI